MNNDSLLSISLPWQSTLDMTNMTALPSDTLLTAIIEFPASDIVLIDDQHKPCGWIPLAQLAKSMLTAWQQERAFYKALLAAVDDAITVIDQDGVIFAWNPSSAALYGYPAAETKNISDLFEEETLISKAAKGNKSILKHYHQPRPNIHVLITALPVYWEEHLIGAISVDRNITDFVKINDELTQTTAYARTLEKQLEKERVANPFKKISGKSAALQQV